MDFARAVTAAYGSGVSLFLACGPATDAYCGAVAAAAAALTALDPSDPGKPRQALYLNQTAAATGVGLGCCGHPTAGDDTLMAGVTAPVIGQAMGWQ